MIEVLFGESEAGSMKIAKSGNETVLSHFHNGEKGNVPLDIDTIVPIKGDANEVVCIGFMLDIGDIQQSMDSEYRSNLVYSMLYQEQWGHDSELSNELKQVGNVYFNELKRLESFVQKGESIRIWYSSSPYSLCGLYFVCKLLYQKKNQVFSVKLPEHVQRENIIQSYQNWGEVESKDFEYFLQYQTVLSNFQMKMYAAEWNKLKEDNSPLRAVVNGQLIGVSDDFYDFLIWKRLNDKPIKQGRLIGDILGYYPVGISDWWYANRIQYYIEKERIEVVEESDNRYARVIQL